MKSLLAVSVVLAAAVFSSVQCEKYVYHPRLLSSGWGWSKKPIVAVSKGWGWKFPTIKGIGIYGGIRVHHGQSQGGGGGWGSISSGGWGGGGGGGGGHGGWGWKKPEGWGWQKPEGWGWGGHGGGGGGGGGGHGGWGWKKPEGWGWGGHGGGGGYDDDDDYERSSLPILVQDIQEADSTEDSSSVESGEVQEGRSSDFYAQQGPFDYPYYVEPVWYQ